MITNLKSAANDAASLPRDADHASAYRDLDGPLHDLQNMHFLLDMIIKGMGRASVSREDDFVKLVLPEGQIDALHFAAGNVAEQITALVKSYDANFEILAAVA